MAFSYSPKIITEGLVLYLDAANPYSYVSGSTSWNDISRGGNNGTLVNGPTFNSANGGSIVFDGVDDIGFLPLTLDTSTNFTIDVTAKCSTMIQDPSPQNRQTIWSLTTDTKYGYEILDLEIWNDGLSSFNGNGTSYATPLIQSFFPLNSNSVNNYTISKSGSTQSWYINSTLRQNATQTYSTSSQYFKLGSRGAGSTSANQQWNGLIYSVKIYNRALSAQEVLQNYNATKTRFGLT
jgi:hypothetical protein